MRAVLLLCLLCVGCPTRQAPESCMNDWNIPAQFELPPSAAERCQVSDGGVPDYLLTLNQDAGTLTEDFVRDGRTYRITYRATECNLVFF